MSLSLLPSNIFLIAVYVLYFCCKKSPQLSGLRKHRCIYLIVSEVTRGRSHWAKIKVSADLSSFFLFVTCWGRISLHIYSGWQPNSVSCSSWVEISISLWAGVCESSSASRVHLCSLAHGFLSSFSKSAFVALNLSDLLFYLSGLSQRKFRAFQSSCN